jgi:hypothetical protein
MFLRIADWDGELPTLRQRSERGSSFTSLWTNKSAESNARVRENVPNDARQAFSLIAAPAARLSGLVWEGSCTFDLLMVFLGLWDEWEISGILEDHGLIDDLEAQHMQDLLQAGRDPEIALKEYVREAYLKYYKTTKLVN